MGKIRILLGALVLLVSGQVNAALITFDFSGTINGNQGIGGVEDIAGLLDGSIVEGTVFSGSYSFDSTVSPTLARPPFETSFATYYNIGSVAATVGNYTLTSSIEVIVENDFGSLNLDAYSPRTSGNAGSFTNGLDTFEGTGWVWTIEDRDGSVFSSLELPLSPPDLTEFESNQFLISLEQSGTGEVVRIWGSMDTLDVRSVPEPSALLLFGTGLIGLVGFSRRRKAA